jgi:hypothetical protein
MLHLLERLEADRLYTSMEHYIADLPEWTLLDKFRVVNESIQTEPLGFCGFAPEVWYRLDRVEKHGTRVTIHYGEPLTSYLLPLRYAAMVSAKDIEDINSGRVKYYILRKVKKCGVSRVRFDHKTYIWDLVLRYR